jgi:hypothetical protein
MESVVQECKEFINANKGEELKEYYEYLITTDVDLDWPNLFQKVYIHACLKKRKDIADWLTTLFPQFDPITQIAFRQVFFYGRWLLAH